MTTETVTWRPIEEAPKDRELLLWFPGCGAERGKWNTESYHRRPQPHWASWALGRLHGVRWCRCNQPTHYAELLRGPSSAVLDAAAAIVMVEQFAYDVYVP